MKNNEQNPPGTKKQKHHFMHFVLDTDQKNNPMPSDASDSILKKILSFFISYHKTDRSNHNG